MTTETLDKLYLEWSQFTRAKTAKEIALAKLSDKYGLALMMIREGCADPIGVADRALSPLDHRDLRELEEELRARVGEAAYVPHSNRSK